MMIKNPGIRFSRLVWGALLLMLPNVNIIDVFPDFIGYLLLASAISYPADAMPYFDDARRGMKKLMWINLSKIPALFVMVMLLGNDASQKSIIPVFSLSYAVVELIFAIPAFGSFFDGVSYLGERFGCDEVFTCPPSLGKATPALIKKLTLFFICFKAAMSTLPELSLISVAEYRGTVEDAYTLIISRYYPQFLLIALLLTTVVGLIWSSYFIIYTRYLAGCESINRAVAKEYMTRANYLGGKRSYAWICGLLTMFAVGTGLGVDVILDNYNILPSFLSAAVFFVAFSMARRIYDKAWMGMVLSAGYFGTSLAAWITKLTFNGSYKAVDITKGNEGAAALHGSYVALSIAQAVLAFGAACCMIGVMLQIVGSYCGRPAREEYQQRELEGYRDSVGGSIRALVIPYAAAAAATAAAAILSGYTRSVPADASQTGSYYVNIPLVPWFWVVPTLLWLICLWANITSMQRLKEGMEQHFEL